MADIFISYSRKDKEFVCTLHQALSQSQRDAWVDWEDIPVTAEWWKEIEAGIEGADTFIFVISPDSVASKVCYQEIEHAAKLNKRLFPIVRREGFAIEQVHEALQRHNWLFFRPEDDFDQAFEMLCLSFSGSRVNGSKVSGNGFTVFVGNVTEEVSHHVDDTELHNRLGKYCFNGFWKSG